MDSLFTLSDSLFVTLLLKLKKCVMDCWIVDDASRVAVTVDKGANETLANRRLTMLADKRSDSSA
jgi:hypothetical protein